jgi:hypothetical protein
MQPGTLTTRPEAVETLYYTDAKLVLLVLELSEHPVGSKGTKMLEQRVIGRERRHFH